MRTFLLLSAIVMLGACSASGDAPVETPGLAALGEQIFSDRRLGTDGTTSCASCHDPGLAFSDGNPVSTGVFGRAGTRNAPSLLDVGIYTTFFWDGREDALEAAVLQPFTNFAELGHGDIQDVLERLHAIPAYRSGFSAAVGREQPQAGDVAKALVAFLGSLDRGETRYEQFLATGDASLLSQDEQAGLELFEGRAQCGECHTAAAGTFVDNRFHHTGIGFERIAGNLASLLSRIGRLEAEGKSPGNLVLQDAEIAELGRFLTTRSSHDVGAFRTPTLRNIARTSPYMHDGSVASLEEAIDRELYYRGISLGRPIPLTTGERRQLASFLQALTIE